MSVNKAANTANTANTADKSAPTFVETLIEQITELGGDRKTVRELNGFIRYQLSGLSRSLIDYEVSAKVIGTPDADTFVGELVLALTAVAKKTEDRDVAALLRRFAKILETDYACVRAAAIRRAR